MNRHRHRSAFPRSRRLDPAHTPGGWGFARFAAGILLLLSSLSAFAATPAQDAAAPVGMTRGEGLEAFVDDVMAEQFEAYPMAGASVTVVRGEKILLSKGYGFANLSKGVPVDARRTVFATASVAKLFTSTAVMQLVERGALDLDADVNAYLTAFQIPERFGEPIRIRHLLAHTAGFEDKPVAGLLSRTGGPDLETSLVRRMPARVRPPGLYVSYSNYGAALAGYIVAEVSGRPWEAYLESEILDPLDMTRASGRQPIPARLAENMSTAYHAGPDGLVPTGHEYVPLSPAGGMVSTTDAMANFMIAHLQHGAYGETRILEESTVRRMHSRLFTHDARLPGNAHGFWEGMANGQRYLYHGGDTASYTLLVLVPEHGLGFYVAYNSPDGAVAREDFKKAFLDRAFPPSGAAATEGARAASDSFGAVAGTYGINRISATTLTKLMALGGALSVSSEDGYLVTEMPVVGRQRWVEGEPLSFTAVDGSDRLIFRTDERGRVEGIFFGGLPMLAFVPIAWYDRVELHVTLLAVGLLALLSALVAWPFVGRQDRGSSGPRRPVAERVARRLPAITSLFYVLFFAALATFLLDPLEVEFGLPPILAVALTLGLVAGACTLASVVIVFFAWRRGFWSVIERLHFSLVALACVSLAWQLHNWNLLGFRV